MARGYPDYTYFQFPLGVSAGGTGVLTLTLHGVLLGQATSGIVATDAGSPYEVLTVPSGGGDPFFDAVHLDQAAAITGILAKANGGNGTATPALVQGSGITISGNWPAQTITNASPASGLGDPVTVAHGGNGTATPALVQGSGITISGSWPAQTITNASPASGLGDPVTVAHGGNGTATPALVQGSGITISGSWPAQTITNASPASGLGDPVTVAHGGWGTNTGSYTGTGAITLQAGGAGSHISLLPTGSEGIGFGVASPLWAFHFMSGSTAVNLMIERVNNTTDECLYGVTPTGVISSTNPIWAFGIRANTANASIMAYDGSADKDLLTIEFDGHFTFGGVRVAPTPTAGQILIASAANAAAWTTPDGCRAYNSAAESITNSTVQTLTFDSERYDNGNLHSTVTNTSRLTAAKAGKYFITGHVVWAGNTTGYRALWIHWNASQDICGQCVQFTSADPLDMSVSTVFYLAAAQYVELTVEQKSGVALNVVTVAYESPEFAMQWIGP